MKKGRQDRIAETLTILSQEKQDGYPLNLQLQKIQYPDL